MSRRDKVALFIKDPVISKLIILLKRIVPQDRLHVTCHKGYLTCYMILYVRLDALAQPS